jgi:uncharacterized membrane protein
MGTGVALSLQVYRDTIALLLADPDGQVPGATIFLQDDHAVLVFVLTRKLSTVASTQPSTSASIAATLQQSSAAIVVLKFGTNIAKTSCAGTALVHQYGAAWVRV